MTEMFEEMKKYNIPQVRITEDEWKKEYANTYSILNLDNNIMDCILAAEDIISIYLLLEAKKKEVIG